MIIYTNAPVDTGAYALDRNGDPIEIESNGTYKCFVRKTPDGDPVLIFQTGGGSGVGTLTVLPGQAIEDITVDLFWFQAEQAMVADLELGNYLADVLRTDNPSWVSGFEVTVRAGITEP